MNFLADFIVYLWLIPLLAQILLPLAILGVFGLTKIFGGFRREAQETVDAGAMSTVATAGKAA